MANDHPGTGKTLSSIERMFDIVQVIEDRPDIGPTEIAEELDVAKSTIQPHLRTLERRGYVLNDGGYYRLSLKFLEHGGKARQQLPVYRIGKEVLDPLAAETNELVNLATEENDEAVIVYTTSGEEAAIDLGPVGKRIPLTISSLSKAILSRYSRKRVQEIIDQQGLPEYTENTVTDPDEFHEDIQRTKERGYSLDEEEGNLGIVCIGAPIVDETKTPIGSISVSGSATKMRENQTEIANKVQNAADVIGLRYLSEKSEIN